MLKKYNWVIILLFISGFFLSVTSQNNFENPLPHDIDDRHEFGVGHPSGDGFEHGRKEEFRNKKITPELEERINDALKMYFPNFHDKAVMLKKNHPRTYRKLLRKLRRHIRRSREPREEKKDLITMIFEESEIDILIHRFKATDNKDEKTKLKTVIRKKISEGFDKRENLQKKVIEKIEKNIEKKKKMHQDRIRDKEEIINDHLEKLLK